MQFTIKSVSKFVALALLAGSATTALAQSAGDTVISTGWAHIAPQDSSTPLSLVSPIALTLAGTGAGVNSTDTLGFATAHFFTDNIVGSLDLGVPPTYKLVGKGTLASVGQIGKAKQWAPAALAKYYFGNANSTFRPMVGLGVTHVNYTNIELTSAFQSYVQTSFGPTAMTTAKLTSAWAPVYNVGASYSLTKDWSLGFSVSYVPLKTTGNLTTTPTPLGTVHSTTSLTLNPIVAYASVGYRF